MHIKKINKAPDSQDIVVELLIFIFKSTNVYQDDQFCSRLKLGIGGSVHGVQDIWDANSSTENCGFLLVDVKNLFNKINHAGIMWTVRHLWPSGARFFLLLSLFIARVAEGNGTAIFLHSREGVMQGVPLSMVAYGIGVLTLIKQLKAPYPEFTWDWYADNAGSLGTYDNIELYFNSLRKIVPVHGY